MSSGGDIRRTKLIWCVPFLAEYLNKEYNYNIVGQFTCRFGEECNHAHNAKEIMEAPYNKAWNDRDKSNINLLNIKNNIIEVISTSKDAVTEPNYRAMINNIETMQFDELLHFWFDITCYHRRLAKEVPAKESWTNRYKPTPIKGYLFKNDIPKFYLENEDDIWALQRTLRMCSKFTNLNPNKKIYIKDICCGDINCKEGLHDITKLVCINNMLTGKCDCLSDEQNEQKKLALMSEINKIQDIITNKDYKVIISKEKKSELIKKYNELVLEFNSINKKIHLTDQGLIPLSVRIDNEKTKNTVISVDTVEIKKVAKIVKKKT